MKHPFLLAGMKWWLLGLIFLLPFSTAHAVKEPFAISYIGLWSLVFIVGGVGAVVLGQLPLRLPQERSIVTGVILLVLAILYGLLFTDPLRSGMGLLISRLLLPLGVGFLAYQLLATKVVQVEEIVAAFFYSFIPLTIYGLLQVIGWLPTGHPGRITGLYLYPNTFARYMDVGLLLSLPWLLVTQGRVASSWRKARWMLWGCGVLLLLASQSYNGVASFLIGLALALAFLPREFSRLKMGGLTAIALVVLAAGLFAPSLPKWQTTINDSRLTRWEFWQVAGKVIRQHPWTGVGIKGWESNYNQWVQDYGPNHPPLNWGSLQPHNVFLDSLLKAGIPGLLAITFVLLLPIWKGGQLAKKSHWQQGGWFGVGALAYGCSLLAFGLIDDPLWSDDTVPVLFLVLACLAWLWCSLPRSEGSQGKLRHSG